MFARTQASQPAVKRQGTDSVDGNLDPFLYIKRRDGAVAGCCSRNGEIDHRPVMQCTIAHLLKSIWLLH